MNEFKKEEQRKFLEARKGLSEEQLEKLNREDQIKKEVDTLARKIHIEKFPEEYDFIYDSWSDIKDRKKGINPMSEEYSEKVAKKREEQGVSPLNDSGLITKEDSFQLCKEEAKKQIHLANKDK